MKSELKVVAFEITRKCRFNCLHCRASADEFQPDRLPTDQCKQILKAVADYAKCTVILTGGEPLERPDFYDIAAYGASLGHKIALATCGYLITGTAAAKIKQAKITALSFSLDGAAAKTHDAFRRSAGAYDAVIDAAKIAKNAAIRFQINTTVTKQNFGEIESIAELAQTLGAYCFNPFILVPTGRGEKIKSQLLSPAEYHTVLGKLLELRNKLSIDLRVTCGPQFAQIAQNAKGCLGAKEFGFISCKGDVQICGFLQISAGNIVQNDYNFADIWENSPLFKDIRNIKAYKGKCGLCEYVSRCGGCRARAYGLLADYLAPDPICSY